MKSCRLVVIALLASLPLVFTSSASSGGDYHFDIDSITTDETSRSDDSTVGIREDIPTKFADRYQAWKKEFLSTESGREQWNRYATNPLLKLTITVSRDNAEGATTGRYKWNDKGQLIAATIVLGFRLDQGYPNPIYFPVMNSLVPTGTANDVTGNTLAATKMAHEFGHVNRTAQVDGTLYQLQTQLIPQYNKIFLSNGRDPKDPRLVEMAQKIGGTPVEIWEDREYWDETSRSDDSTVGIREDIPTKFADRYQAWKKEFLSTESGREQWNRYATNPLLKLTITVSRDNAEGATTGRYKWNDKGQLIAATIVLGFRLDQGYPNPIYFPVMNSLVPTGTANDVTGNTLAATKMAHEFGHVNRTAQVDGTLYQLQTQLIPQYNKIFLSNGRDPKDPRLVEMAQKIGGTPVEIWEDREYWGETNAMVFLRDRFTEQRQLCPIFNRIRSSIDLYAKGYERRFLDIAQSVASKGACGW